MLPKRARRLRQQRQSQQQEQLGSGGGDNAEGAGQALSKERRRDENELPYEALTPPDRLPRALSWRGTPADRLVYDQANCGRWAVLVFALLF